MISKEQEGWSYFYVCVEQLFGLKINFYKSEILCIGDASQCEGLYL
jgi:hypothetical protein